MVFSSILVLSADFTLISITPSSSVCALAVILNNGDGASPSRTTMFLSTVGELILLTVSHGYVLPNDAALSTIQVIVFDVVLNACVNICI